MKHLICRKGFGYVLVLRHGTKGDPMGEPPIGSRDEFLFKSSEWERMEAKIADLEAKHGVKCIHANFKPKP